MTNGREKKVFSHSHWWLMKLMMMIDEQHQHVNMQHGWTGWMEDGLITRSSFLVPLFSTANVTIDMLWCREEPKPNAPPDPSLARSTPHTHCHAYRYFRRVCLCGCRSEGLVFVYSGFSSDSGFIKNRSILIPEILIYSRIWKFV